MKKRYIALFAIVFIVDRLTKWWAATVLAEQSQAICYGLNFDLSWNRGVSWGIFSSSSGWGFGLLTAFIILLVAGLVFYTLWRSCCNKPIWWEVLVLAGAVSNLIDRFYYGAVLDFIELYIGSFAWPIFNVADACIVIGMCGMFIQMSWDNA